MFFQIRFALTNECKNWKIYRIDGGESDLLKTGSCFVKTCLKKEKRGNFNEERRILKILTHNPLFF